MAGIQIHIEYIGQKEKQEINDLYLNWKKRK